MIKSIKINSEVEFVIVGPILHKDGIIIQSQNTDIDLVGTANYIYKEDASSKSVEIKNLLRESAINYLWSDFYDIDSSGRKARLLFCFRGKEGTEVRWRNFFGDEYENKSFSIAFRNFIENAFSIIYSITTEPESIWIEKRYETTQDSITWHISPLLLRCLDPDGKY